jgi:hypothetical protein
MTDINLKTETPDTTLPTTGFLFGADSQAAASPSVFTVQSVATTLLGSTTLSGATITANAPVLNLEQTWNAGGVTFTGLKFNVASDTSAAASLLMDLQVGTVSKFLVFKNGCFGGSLPTCGFLFVNGPALRSTVGVILKVHQTSYDVRMHSSTPFGWTASDANDNLDTILTRRDAANLRFGAADAAAAVAQTLSVQSVVAGTSNIAGANLTITGSQGTGTGAGGSIIFQVAPAGSSGTAQNALTTALTLDGGNASASFTAGVVTGARFRASTNFSILSLFEMDSPSNGVLTFRNWGSAGFDRLQFGGTTSSFPALKRSSASLIVRLADDSANAALESASLKTDAPAGGTAATWKLGTVASVSPTSQNRTIEVDIGGTIYYISAKTTND